MADKRATTPTSEGSAKRARQTSTSRSASPRTPLNAQTSTLLKLPAELRNHIYSHVFGRHFIHVEVGLGKTKSKPPTFNEDDWPPFPPREHDVWSRWATNRCLHYYLCKSPVSEEDAYRRSQDSSLNEQLPGEEEQHANYWRPGDTFHIDPCQPRHENCYPGKDHDFDWMLTPGELEGRKKVHHVCLSNALGMGLLQTCSQVYQEAKYVPLSQNTFAFREPHALIWMLSILSLSQSNALRSLCMFWTAGGMGSMVDARQWNKWLFTPKLVDRLQGLRVIHLSFSILHLGMGTSGPFRHDLHSTTLDSWVEGLNPLCELPLEQATVIISDDPESKFGMSGYSDNQYLSYGWNHDHENWLHLRDLECFTADEKRGWAEQLRKRLLKET